MSLPNTLNSLPVGAGILQMAINRGGITPPSQNFAGPLLCAIALGCAALCEAIEGTLLVCAVCVLVGGVCYTIEQAQKEIIRLNERINNKRGECATIGGAVGPGVNAAFIKCMQELQALLDELARWTRGLADARGLGTSTGNRPFGAGSGSPTGKY